MNDATRDNWQRIKALFKAALDRPADQRDAFLREACGEDADLLRQVQSLLKQHETADDAADASKAGGTIAETQTLQSTDMVAGEADRLVGTHVGHYKLLELLGEGGFGAVYVAEQERPVRRRVALKVIKLGMDTRQVIARFEAERQALAMMDHPNIARVLDAGATDAGRPWFAMELVRGVPITHYCDAANLPAVERLELFIHVCRAVQHAHQKGVIHRDLKPSNVLVTLHDGKPVPKVIDFGIAKAVNAQLTEKTVYTRHHQMIGTPAYMSPEQAEMSGLDIDTRSDVYSLGVLLYELLTGSTPFKPEDLLQAGWGEMQRIIREVDPPKPSTRVNTLGDTLPSVAARRRVEPKRLGLLLRGDLDWIAMKCLEKDRTRRYETAASLADDLHRHLSGEPVVAAPPSVAYRVRKFVRKHRGAVVTTFVVLMALLLGIAGTSWQWTLARIANRDLDRQVSMVRDTLARVVSTGVTDQAHSALRTDLETTVEVNVTDNAGHDLGSVRIDKARGHGSPAVTLLGPHATEDRGGPRPSVTGIDAVRMLGQYASDMTQQATQRANELQQTNTQLTAERDRAELWAYRGNIAAARIALQERDAVTCRARLNACPKRLRDWEWGHLHALLDDAPLVLRGHEHEVNSAMFSPDGTRVLTVGNDDWPADNAIRMWDAIRGTELFVIHSEHAAFTSAGFAPDGKSFVTLTAPRDYVEDDSFPSLLQVWDAVSGRELHRIPLPQERPDSARYKPAQVALGPNGRRLIWSGPSNRHSALIDLLAPDRVLWLDHPGSCLGDTPFSPDGKLVCTVGRVGTTEDDESESACVWDAATGVLRWQTPPTKRGKESEEILSIDFSAHSHLLLTNHWSGNTNVWDIASGTQLPSPPSVGDEIGNNPSGYYYPFIAACSPDGRLAAGLLENQWGVRVWEIQSGRQVWQFENDTTVDFLRFSPAGDKLVISDTNSSTRLLDAQTGHTVVVLPGQDAKGIDLTGAHSPLSPDGRRLVTKSVNGDVRIWDLPITPGRTEFGTDEGSIYWSIAVPSKSVVVAALEDQTLRVYDAWTGRELRKITGNTSEIYSGDISSDGSRLVTLDDRETLAQVWDLEHGVVIASRDFNDQLRTGELRVHGWAPRFVGTNVLLPVDFDDVDDYNTPPSRKALLEWNPDRDEISTRFEAFSGCGRGISISPAEDRIVFGSSTGERTLVDARTGDAIAKLDPWPSDGWTAPAAFSPDGTRMAGVVRGSDRRERVQIWRATDGGKEAVATFDQETGMIQSLRFSPDGTSIALVTWIGKGAAGGRVILIDAASGKLVWAATNPGKNMDNLDFLPDGSRLVTSRRMFQNGMDFWDASDGAKVFSLPYRLGDPIFIEQKDWRAFSDDGTCLFVRDKDGNPAVLRSQSCRSR